MPLVSKPLPSLEFLNEALRLDVETGQLCWKKRPRHHFSCLQAQGRWNTLFAGNRAEQSAPGGYRRITFWFEGRKQHFAAHRIVWKMVKGVDPVEVIDHINRVQGDNRPSNLRDISHIANLHNSAARTPGRSVLRGGVSLVRGQFRARIRKDGRYVHLGYFPTVAAAEAAIVVAL